MDDVLIYSSTIEEHELLLKAVFTRLEGEVVLLQVEEVLVLQKQDYFPGS